MLENGNLDHGKKPTHSAFNILGQTLPLLLPPLQQIFSTQFGAFVCSSVGLLTSNMGIVVNEPLLLTFSLFCFLNSKVNSDTRYTVLTFRFLMQCKAAILDDPTETAKVCVPAMIYTLQNNLYYIALSHLEATTFCVSSSDNINGIAVKKKKKNKVDKKQKDRREFLATFLAKDRRFPTQGCT